MRNEAPRVILFSFFGLKIAATYLFAGVTLAVGCGYLIGKMHLERYLEDWVTNLQTTAWIEEEKVENIEEIVKFGVMSTPALAMNGKVLFVGRVPTAREIGELITSNETK